jgi:membrane protease YdiL (CAAX protease family)
MDRRLALAALLAVPLVYGINAWLAARLPTLAASGLGLSTYWAMLAAALAASDRDRLRALLPVVSPGRLVNLGLALPVILAGALALRLLGSVILPPPVILAAALAAIVHALLEEAFWRGALIPRATEGTAALALALYWVFHLAWLGVAPLGSSMSPLILALAPLVLGGVWTAARLASGTLGSAIMAHAGFNLFAFVGVAALLQPAA